ncbi:MAG: branched-chain amino acid ABC transporter permease [Caldilineaceae bacterium]
MQSGIFHTDYKSDLSLRPIPIMRWRLAVVMGLAAALPFVVNNYYLTLANQIGIMAIGAIGLNILTGYTGQISLGQGGFMAIGAYTSGILAAWYGAPWWLTIPIACLATALFGGIFGIPSLRLKGLYLAIATLAAQQIIEWVIIRSSARGGEAIPLPGVTFFGQSINRLRFPFFGGQLGGREFWFYWVILFFLIVTAIYTVNLFRTRTGRAFIAIRDQDIAAAVMGVNVFRYKILSFATSSFIVGLAGALQAQYRGIVSFESFTIEVSILYLAAIIIGGLGSVSGSIYGAIFMTLLPAFLSNVGGSLQGLIPGIDQYIAFIRQAVFGIVIILFLVFEPEGIAKIWRNVKDYFRLWPFSY